VLLRLFILHQLESGRCGLGCGAYLPRRLARRGTSGLGLISSGREVSVKVYGVADDDAAGVEPDA
jgi:hypothetical protein